MNIRRYTTVRIITEKVVTAPRNQGDTHTKGEHPRSGKSWFFMPDEDLFVS